MLKSIGISNDEDLFNAVSKAMYDNVLFTPDDYCLYARDIEKVAEDQVLENKITLLIESKITKLLKKLQPSTEECTIVKHTTFKPEITVPKSILNHVKNYA